MPRKRTYLFLFIFCFLLVSSGFLFLSLQEKNNEFNELREERSVLENRLDLSQDRVRELSLLLEEKNDSIEELLDEIGLLEENLSEARDLVNYLRENRSEVFSELNETRSEYIDVSSRASNLSNRVKELRDLVENGYVVRENDFGVLAVYEDSGEGVVLDLFTELEVGDGEMNLDVSNTTYGEDNTQSSFRTALSVSSNYVGVDLVNRSVDQVIVGEDSNLRISGPSAGAAICLAQIGVLGNKTINQSVYITGTIEEGGEIGRVGEIREKVLAAKEDGAELVLVPNGQYREVNGIEVIEVRDISEATEYVFN